jgi:ubiquinone/menaquinone biosynthesis C-methylase UbiE
MSIGQDLLMRAFGRPQGLLGRLGGVIMARVNADFGDWVSQLLEIRVADCVLEVGFGPGAVIQQISKLAPDGYVAGVDQSQEMVQQALARNATAARSGRVDLRYGSVEKLPFDDNRFDKALAINSMQVWPDAIRGLQEMRRVLKSGGRIGLGFTRHSGQPRDGLIGKLNAAGFVGVSLIESDKGLCALATKP